MISSAEPFPIRSHIDTTAGEGWAIVRTERDSGKSEIGGCPGSSPLLDKPDMSEGEMDTIGRATNLPDQVNGKKRKLNEEQMEGLRDQQFSDVTTSEMAMDRDGPSSSAQKERFNAIRTTAEVPAEGAGLRGEDTPVDEPAGSTGGHQAISTQLNVNAPKKLCIRHLRMADEGTTAKLQRVSLDS